MRERNLIPIDSVISQFIVELLAKFIWKKKKRLTVLLLRGDSAEHSKLLLFHFISPRRMRVTGCDGETARR